MKEKSIIKILFNHFGIFVLELCDLILTVLRTNFFLGEILSKSGKKIQ